MAVALPIAARVRCISARWHTAAAFILGMGFALKLTPAALLPLVLIVSGAPRRWLWPIVAFVAAAAAPFVPYLFSSPRGLWYVFQYHLERPLQIESVLGTPMMFGKLIGVMQATWGHSHGSHILVAKGAGIAATASGALTLLAVFAVYLLIWRRRERLRATPPDTAVAVLALILALMTFGKVLSPQYFIWTLPAWALVAPRDKWIAALGGLTLLLTGIEFPALYWRMLDMQPDSVAVLVARNVALVVTLAFTCWRLWGLLTPSGGTARDVVLVPPAEGPSPGGVISPEAAVLIADLGLTVVTQPAFIAARGDRYLVEVDPSDQPWLYPCGSLLAAGIKVAASSDAPYGPADPWAAIAAATHRRTAKGRVLGASERIGAARALALFQGEAGDPGGPPRRVAIGAPADLCLLHGPLAEALADPTSDHVRATVIAGALIPR